MSAHTTPSRGRAAAPARTDAAGARRSARFRPEIQGLRAVAVLLVVVYHIWFNRVSGGVDVFLLLTGFFITGSLLRMADKEGRVRWTAFLSRLLSRLAPAAGVVLAGTLVAAFLIFPAARWREVIAEVAASALYYENWQLALTSVDYLAQGGAASPLQHFWSLSIQGQFYLLWPALIAAAILLTRRTRLTLPRAVFTGSAAVFTLSLTYSIYITSHNQPWAYFDTGARLWEFAAGAMLAVALPHLNLPKRLRITLGWTGLTALITCGALLDVSTLFPGYIALWPVGAAMLIIVAGGAESRYSADRALNWRPLHYIGDLAYPLYLWHWPILIFYLDATEQSSVSAWEGLAIVASSLLLAAATKHFVEDRSVRLTQDRPRPRRLLALAAGFLVPVLAATLVWSTVLDRRASELERMAADPANYPGAAVLTESELAAGLPDLPAFPDPADAAADTPQTYSVVDGFRCHASLTDTEAKHCEFGDPSSQHTIALVGASRSEHWFGALREVVETNGWHMINISKSACRLDSDVPMRSGEVYESCQEWRDNVMDKLDQMRPDVVFTSSTRATLDGETLPEGFVERWEQLGELDIDVVGVRDLPVLSFDGPECLSRNGPDECTTDASASHAESYPALDLPDSPDNASFIDLTEYVCPEGTCRTVVGNVTVYQDSDHITDTYIQTLAPMLETELKAATGW